MAAVSRARTHPALPIVVLQSLRLRSLPIALLSSLVGTMALLPDVRPEPVIAALCALLAVLLQCGTNVLNDAEDAQTGADAFAGAGSSPAMRRGWIDVRSARLIAAACFVGAALLGAGIALLVQKPGLLLLGAAALVVGFAYTAPPLRLAYRPLGELASSIPMGVGIAWGTAAAQTSRVPGSVWWAAVPLALLTAAVLHANNARDRAHDAAVGKRTLATYLQPRAVAAEYRLLLMAVPLAIIAGIALRALPLWTLLALIPGALAVRAALRATPGLDAAAWTRLLIAAVRLHMLTALALCAAFALALIR